MFDAATMYDAPRTSSGRLVDPHAQEWERQYAMFTHLAALSFLLSFPVIPTLILWLVKREKSPFIDDHGREAMNFQISLLLYGLLIIPLLGLLTCGIGFVAYIAILIIGIVGVVQGAISANRGEFYRYPATIRFLH